MIHKLQAHHKEHLSKVGIPEPPDELFIPPDEYKRHHAEWKKTLPNATDGELHHRILAHAAWKKHATPKEIPPAPIVRPTVRHIPRWERYAIIALLLLIALLLFRGKAHAQFSRVNYVNFQNQGTNISGGFFAFPFNFNCLSTLSCGASGNTLSIAGAITTIPLCNAGAVIASSPYSLLADTGSAPNITTKDRTSLCVVSTAGAGTFHVLAGSTSGIGSGFTFEVQNDGAGTWTIDNNASSDTFNIATGSANSDAQSSFTLTSGQHFRVTNSGLSNGSGGVTWYVRKVSGGATLQTNGVNNTSQSTLNLQNSAAFNGLTFTVSNPSAGNVQLGASGTLNNSGLTNSATTVNSQTCTLGSSCTVSDQNLIKSATTYYVCAKATGGNCAYNGDGGQVVDASCPADTCTGLDKTHPKLTIAGAQAVIAGKVLLAVVTIQLADTAGTGTDCYRPSDVMFDNHTQGYSQGLAFDFDATAGGGQALTDAYPSAYIYLIGNTSTPNNVLVTGASACANVAAVAKRGFIFSNTNFRIAGMKINYFVAYAVHGINGLGYLETINATSDAVANEYAFTMEHGVLRYGGTIAVTNYGLGLNIMGSGALLDDKTPLGCGTFNFSSSLGQAGIEVQEGAHEFIDCGTYSFTGTGAYAGWQAQDQGTIEANDAAQVTITLNDANMTGFKALFFSDIETAACTSLSDWTCTNTSSAHYVDAESGSTIGVAATSGYGTNIATDDVVSLDAQILINPFSPGNIGFLKQQANPINQTGKTAAISTATLCAATTGACGRAGQYHIHWNFWGSGTACSSVTAGSVTFLLTWTDENAVTHSAVALEMQSQTGAATEAVQASFPFQTALANESASGDYTISTNGSVIQYATGYVACTTGTGTYNLRVAVVQVQ